MVVKTSSLMQIIQKQMTMYTCSQDLRFQKGPMHAGALELKLHTIHGPSTLIIVNSTEKRRELEDMGHQFVRELAV